jgi:putative hydrolase of the HAD superfamily
MSPDQTTPVHALLLDADGVMQQNPPGWLERVTACVPDVDRERFAEDLWATEEDALAGRRTFGEVLDEVTARWGVAGEAERLRSLWREAEVDPEMVALVREVRAAGTPCHLVTNQNELRASYLRDSLGYDALFDRLFVSCELGLTKSDDGFFARVVAELDVAPGRLLVVDDSEQHVDAARAAGLQGIHWSLDDGLPALRRRLARHGVPVAVA